MSDYNIERLWVRDIVSNEESIRDMRDYLNSLGHHDAATRTGLILHLAEQINALQQELGTVWHNAERCLSCDGSQAHVTEAVARWRAKGSGPSPAVTDAVKLLCDMEACAARLRDVLTKAGATK